MNTELKMNREQQAVAAENYPLVEKLMNEYALKETDVPDWHGAACVGICRAAVDYYYIKNSIVDTGSKLPLFEEFALPYIIIEFAGETPSEFVLKKIRPIISHLSYDQRKKMAELSPGGIGSLGDTIGSLTF